MPTTRDYGHVIERKLQGNPSLQKAVDRAWLNAKIAQQVYDARTHHGLSQSALAKLVGTQQSAISRIEDADCATGHNVFTLLDIARVLNLELRVELVEIDYLDRGGFRSLYSVSSSEDYELPEDDERWESLDPEFCFA